jgi:hypothetical protein
LLHLSENDTTLNQHVATLREAFRAQPFGKPEQVASAAGAVVDWASDRCDALATRPITQGSAKDMLKFLTTTVAKEPLDYDSARQAAWSFQVLYNELCSDSNVAESDRNVIIGQFRSAMLKLPSGRDASIVDALEENLRARSEYGPEAFRADMQVLDSLLDAKLAKIKPR